MLLNRTMLRDKMQIINLYIYIYKATKKDGLFMDFIISKASMLSMFMR